jgi:hypothetical protein
MSYETTALREEFAEEHNYRDYPDCIRLDHIPGDFGLPVIGNMIDFVKDLRGRPPHGQIRARLAHQYHRQQGAAGLGSRHHATGAAGQGQELLDRDGVQEESGQIL